MSNPTYREVGKVYGSNLYITKTDIQEFVINNFLPIAITTTIFAPLERTKIILQTMDLMSIKSSEKVYKFRFLFPSKKFIFYFSELIKDQGLFSIFRGNAANLYKYLFQSLANIYIFQQINFYLYKDRKDLTKKEIFLFTCLSSLINVSFSYPFEMAHTRICGDMTRMNFKRINSSVMEIFMKCLNEQSSTKNNYLNIFKLYKGYSLGLISNVLYWSLSFMSFDFINKKIENFGRFNNVNNTYSGLTAKILTIFGGSALTSLFASILVYPVDTIKRKIQVNGAFGFQHRYVNNRDCIVSNFKDFKGLYRGFSVHVMKCVPFGLVHYSVIQSFGGR